MKKGGKQAVLSLKDISIHRGGFRLEVDAIDIYPGQIHCLIGPNGCGKTTLLFAILGLIPHGGTCSINGTPYDGTNPTTKASIGYIPDDPELLFEELTAREQWAVTASVLAEVRSAENTKILVDRAEHIASQLAFDPPPQLQRSYSHGMRKKAQIVDALMGRPDLVLTDELHNGLDPIGTHQAEGLLRGVCARGAAVLATSHDLWWAERFADHVYVLKDGRIIAAGSPKQLRKRGEPHLAEAFYRIVGVRA